MDEPITIAAIELLKQLAPGVPAGSVTAPDTGLVILDEKGIPVLIAFSLEHGNYLRETEKAYLALTDPATQGLIAASERDPVEEPR